MFTIIRNTFLITMFVLGFATFASAEHSGEQQDLLSNTASSLQLETEFNYSNSAILEEAPCASFGKANDSAMSSSLQLSEFGADSRSVLEGEIVPSARCCSTCPHDNFQCWNYCDSSC